MSCLVKFHVIAERPSFGSLIWNCEKRRKRGLAFMSDVGSVKLEVDDWLGILYKKIDLGIKASLAYSISRICSITSL